MKEHPVTRYAKHFSTRATPQSEPIPGTPMIANSAGGFTFAVDRWKRLERFLILGSEGGSYYERESALTTDNATAVHECLAEDPARTVRTIVEISEAGRAPKNDPAIFALAMATGYQPAPGLFPASTLALDAVSRVCRIGTHLFQFAECVEAFRGWGRGLRRGIGAWYTTKEPQSLAYQLAKYQKRNGWSHRDLLRLAHPNAPTPAHDALFRWSVGGMEAVGGRTVKSKGDAEPKVYGSLTEHLPTLIAAMDAARSADRPTLVKLIVDHELPRECIPTEQLNAPEVWEALLLKMPLTAMVRNLAKMTEVGLLKPLSKAANAVTARLGDEAYIRKSRLHPLAILLAAKTYAAGRGHKGSLTWTPVSQVNDALDAAFYKAFANVQPSGKRTLLALDVSGSMAVGSIGGTSLSPRDASAAMALVTAKVESQYQVVGFTATSGGFGGMHGGGDPGLTPIDLSGASRLSDVITRISVLPMGGTDCAIPMLTALQKRWEVDTFQVYTDSETWAGRIQPVQALRQYRDKTGIPAKLIVVGMVSNGFTIADPSDAGMLDVVGFDANAPAVMADFARE
jgi:60 kDa SS-A/Ro ribonucleoprotein